MCSIFLSQVGCLGQTKNHEFIYDKDGNKIAFNEIENVTHIGFASGVSMNTRNEVLADLSNIADYYMLPDSSYCFTVDPGYDTQFKTKVYANSYVAYCQNEYRDSLGGVVWGTNRIIVKMKPNYSIFSLSLHAGIGGRDEEMNDRLPTSPSLLNSSPPFQQINNKNLQP